MGRTVRSLDYIPNKLLAEMASRANFLSSAFSSQFVRKAPKSQTGVPFLLGLGFRV